MLFSFRYAVSGLLGLTLAGCGGDGDGGLPLLEWNSSPAGLLRPLTNNGVASLESDGGCTVFSSMGIGEALTSSAITNHVFMLQNGEWTRLPTPPSAVGRVATSLIGVAGKVVLLGGYSVAPNGLETSFDDVDIFDPDTQLWSSGAAIPVPIDDAVALAWMDRYVVVVSGWSNTSSVSDVQLYDTQMDSWVAATSFPGTPVFGHAGAIDGNRLVLIDGVGESGTGFELVSQSWQGILDPANPEVIVWSDLGPHPGPARYRAAGGTTKSGEMWFHGGSETPYNFDGRDYESGQPALPLASTLTHTDGAGFATLGAPKPTATMDHRALARCNELMISVGGMSAGPLATEEVWQIRTE